MSDCYNDCLNLEDCISYSFYYTADTYAPRCDAYFLDVQDALAVDENYDTIQVWYDIGCGPPTQDFPPPTGLPPNKKIETRAAEMWARVVGWIEGGIGM